MPTVAELVRRLGDAGFWLCEHSKRHDLFEHPVTGRRVMVPRHWSQEMGTGLFRKILRDAGGMTLELPEIRPAVLSPALSSDLSKLLSFRHFFRHAYSVALDEDRVRAHGARLQKIRAAVRSDLSAFAEHCVGRARSLEAKEGS